MTITRGRCLAGSLYRRGLTAGGGFRSGRRAVVDRLDQSSSARAPRHLLGRHLAAEDCTAPSGRRPAEIIGHIQAHAHDTACRRPTARHPAAIIGRRAEQLAVRQVNRCARLQFRGENDLRPAENISSRSVKIAGS